MSRVSTGDVLFVGSVPGASVEDVLRRCAQSVGEHAFAFPDGELGARQMWIGGLGDLVFSQHPAFQRLPDTIRPFGTYGLPMEAKASFEGVYPYSRFAIESYRTFARLRDAGEIPRAARFQVSLPTPHAVITAYFPRAEGWPRLIAAWAGAMRHGYEEMLAEIPPEDLVIQLDYCSELLEAHGDIDEEACSLVPGGSREEKIEAYTDPGYLTSMSENLPETVTLGYHLCAGTYPQWPVSRLEELGLVVELANRLMANTPRRVDFLHLPVMVDADESYFAPLRDLRPGPKVFLGLECRDGVEELNRRISAARQHLAGFGIAHFCGYGREYADQVDELLADLAAGAVAL